MNATHPAEGFRMTPRRKRLAWIVAGVAVLATAVGLVLYALSSNIVFFFTPILWQVETLKNRTYLAEMNPVYHWIETIRAPLLGHLPSVSNYLWSLASLVVLSLLATYYLGRYRSRIAYWL